MRYGEGKTTLGLTTFAGPMCRASHGLADFARQDGSSEGSPRA